jgi:two-component system KDP operon response regulator KdpE
MKDKLKVLTVDDEPQIIRVMRHILSANQFSVRAAGDGDEALEVFVEWQPDLVISDLQMPTMDGLEFCRKVRERSGVPIIVVSVKNDEKTIIEALDAGADDYVTKPFGSGELLARIRSVLRRVPEREETPSSAGDFTVDTAAHRAMVRDVEVRLTPKEFDLLACLVANPEKVLTHSFLLKKVWGNYYTEQPESLRVLVGNLRKKIEEDPANPRYLLTEPWIGYRFVPKREFETKR